MLQKVDCDYFVYYLNYLIIFYGNYCFRVPKNLKSVVYSTAIKYGAQDDWDFLWNQYLHTSVVSEQVEIINALACSQDPQMLEQ